VDTRVGGFEPLFGVFVIPDFDGCYPTG